MLRPATPLSVLLLAAFVLLLLSVLSVPVTKIVPLGKFKEVTFGVFGYCQDNGECSGIRIGYDTRTLLDNENEAFDLPVGVRDTLSSILVVHPVAALLSLVMFIMAAASHFHVLSHSSRYLLLLFFLILITFLVTLLAFLVDVLLFIPHMAWGSYIVLAATIILALSGIASCAMRRTLVSRKARLKRIGENAEMSGENYYNREGQVKPPSPTQSQPTLPMVSGANPAAVDKLPQFTTYETHRKDDQVSDERVPLTHVTSVEKKAQAMPQPGQTAALGAPIRSPSRDNYGNPMSGPDAYGNRRGRGDMGSARGFRGRGGGGGGAMGVYGRGDLGPYGPPMRGRGGSGRGGPRGGRAGYGPLPRPGPYGSRGGRPGPPSGYGNGATQYEHQQPPMNASGNGWNSAHNLPMESNHGFRNSPSDNDLPRAESPPPLPGLDTAHEAIEMDASPTETPVYTPYRQTGDNDADIVGMVGLQQGRVPARHDTIMSDGSRYSTDDVYVPPRMVWNQASARNSPVASSLEAQPPPPRVNYYEDVHPQFAGPLRPNNQLAENEYDDAQEGIGGGTRSPAESERSNLTSISQRGVNPRWNPNVPPMPQFQGQGIPPRRAVPAPRRQDVILDNPDFQMPGTRPKGPRTGPGMVPGGAYPTNAP
ncbi:hypothetical protein CDD82_82 [Ophiocordyceps australis]|uniref:PH-response regulator protein palI/RIM9 n=1 Tax=Ophiocordyceps australis TaxID=1399860 RepID=A0A2C5ZQN9_9HYPO|nr:hypothetical protein CDD82_82 [Ophiocordyceps australis]